MSINDAGTVVGTAREPGFGATHGVVWFSDGTTLELAASAGATGVFVSFIDNAGVIGGGYYAAGQSHPGYWTLTLDPQTKDDCKDGGWEAYGFENQGQCVRLIETGTDSR